MLDSVIDQLKAHNLLWVLESATDAMLITGRDGHIVMANAPLESMFGYAAGTLQGQPVEVLLPAMQRERHVALRTAYMNHPHACSMGRGLNLSGQRRDGQAFPVEVSLSPLLTDQAVLLVMATVRDLTAYKAAGASLQESEARMRAIVDTAVEAIITIDERGIVDRFNPAAERLFGYQAQEIVGANVATLMPADQASRHDGYIERYLQSGEKKIIGIGRDVVGKRKDGSQFPMHLSIAEMWLGEKRMFTGMVRDITESKLAEQALRRSQADLQQLAGHLENIKEAERKRIAQEIHDELGALFTSINANLSVYADRIGRHGGEIDRLLLNAIALAGSGFQAVRRVIDDLRPSVLDQLGVWAALESTIEDCRRRSTIRFVYEIDAQIAELDLAAELGTLVFRVVQEALTNAIRHAQCTEIAVNVDLNADRLQVEIRDNGIGIDMQRNNPVSWGIVGMIERARYFGCALEVQRNDASGTVVRLILPALKLHAQ